MFLTLPLREGQKDFERQRESFLGRGMPKPERRLALTHARARHMRSVPTDAERKLWGRLRSKQLAGIRFRRQQPIGPYIADFFCSAAKLIVELDGGQHGADLQVEHDAARARWLAMRGYRVIRFANEDFLREPDVVMDAIGRAMMESQVTLGAS